MVMRMPTRSRKPQAISAAQINSFRLQRHHLLDPKGKDMVAICRDVCGVQAQIMSAAHLQLWARNPALTREAIEDALWKKRSLVKTSLMRQTLHLIPSDEFSLYIEATKRSRIAAVLRIMARFKITAEEAHDFSSVIVDALASGPLGRAAIIAAVQPKASKRMRAWMEKVWSIVRIPVAEGRICYGAGEGNQTTFIRTDQWLPKFKPVEEHAAKLALLSRYLRAFGPATLKDFIHWSGISSAEAQKLLPLPENKFAEVAGGLLLREDVSALQSASSSEGSVHLLPYFDIYLLAHATKEHLLNLQHYKRVYRNQGWISPVLLIDGKITGVWGYELSRQRINIQVEPFARIDSGARAQIQLRARALGEFFQRTPSLSFKN